MQQLQTCKNVFVEIQQEFVEVHEKTPTCSCEIQEKIASAQKKCGDGKRKIKETFLFSAKNLVLLNLNTQCTCTTVPFSDRQRYVSCMVLEFVRRLKNKILYVNHLVQTARAPQDIS